MLVGLALLLIVVGVALMVMVEGIFGELIIVAGIAALLYKLVRVADAETGDRQAEIDARADEIRSQHRNPV